ncbi:hypothetical protein SH449x_005219 [Pirellulaceae bacterium SH449]
MPNTQNHLQTLIAATQAQEEAALNPMSDAIVPWFVSETCYEQFRSTATDSDVFFDSHKEWVDAAMEHERLAERAGVIIVRIRMRFEDFEAWRVQHGLLNHADTRLQYAELVAQKLLGSA